jgi:hypothetical protein
MELSSTSFPIVRGIHDLFDHYYPQKSGVYLLMKFSGDLKSQLNFYQWSKQDALAELEDDFRLLRSIKGFAALNSFSYFKSLDQNSRIELAQSLVKGFFRKEVLELAGDPLNETDIILRNSFNKHVYTHPIAFRDQEKIISKMIANGSFNKKSVKNTIKRVLKSKLKHIFQKVDLDQSSMWEYNSNFGNWLVRTRFDIGGYHQLRYGHTIYSLVDNSTFHPSNISFLKWVGVGAETEWEFIEEEEIDSATDTITTLCHRFLENIPYWLEA